MEESVAQIQARLRRKMSKKLEVSPEVKKAVKFVSFEIVGNPPAGSDTLSKRAIAELSARGHRVGFVQRYAPALERRGKAMVNRAHMDAGAAVSLSAMDDELIIARKIEHEPTFEELMERLGDVDVVIGESFGFLNMPKIIVGQKPGEVTSFGFGGIVAYIADSVGESVIPCLRMDDDKGIADFIERVIMGIEPADCVKDDCEESMNAVGE